MFNIIHFGKLNTITGENSINLQMFTDKIKKIYIDSSIFKGTVEIKVINI